MPHVIVSRDGEEHPKSPKSQGHGVKVTSFCYEAYRPSTCSLCHYAVAFPEGLRHWTWTTFVYLN